MLINEVSGLHAHLPFTLYQPVFKLSVHIIQFYMLTYHSDSTILQS
jgi:hypothetical protein